MVWCGHAPLEICSSMTHYLYVLYSLKDNNFYIGYTSDFRVRVAEHRKGLVVSTKSRLPLALNVLRCQPITYGPGVLLGAPDL